MEKNNTEWLDDVINELEEDKEEKETEIKPCLLYTSDAADE